VPDEIQPHHRLSNLGQLIVMEKYYQIQMYIIGDGNQSYKTTDKMLYQFTQQFFQENAEHNYKDERGDFFMISQETYEAYEEALKNWNTARLSTG
jgi:hypothetical protein